MPPKPLLIYCYDAYCGWCYGFSPVMQRIAAAYSSSLDMEVLSGGMILPEQPVHFSTMAGFIAQAYKRVEETTGVKFGDDFLWHVFHPDETDWYPHSEKPAIALCIFKEMHPQLSVAFSSDLQMALNSEGRDLTDDEAYRHLLIKYEIDQDDFYKKLHSEDYKEKAYYEFALMKQLRVDGYPAVFIQTSDSKFYQIAKGYTDYETLKANIEKVLVLTKL
jgi:putative protein-disulfide isomerase